MVEEPVRSPLLETVPEPPQAIPDKLYFRIGEVAKLVGVKPYVLRFWESQFPVLAPKKSGTGQRLYRRKEVELLMEIRTLLHARRFTIEGAKKHLAGQHTTRKTTRAPKVQHELFAEPQPTLDDVRRELQSILDLLK